MNKKYTGKEPNKILYQKTIDAIENNIKYKIKDLKFLAVENTQYYSDYEVIRIIDNTINDLVRKIYF